ncbi:unnamed protein product [Penicillium olsonii]|nr:unnamed protein product [Penicillium olsonii]
MSHPPHPGAFDNQGNGTLNAKTGDGNQNNNNSSGNQHNYNFYGHDPSSILKDARVQGRANINDEIIRSLAFPQMLNRRESIEPRYQNTCQWILELEGYKSWRQQDCGLLWIKGKPGAGKSTLMAFLHGKLRKSSDGRDSLLLEFFFSARGTELQRTPLGMVRSLLVQILKYYPNACSELREAYLERCKDFGGGNWEWTQVQLQELFRKAVLNLATQQKVTIFVDALDEAGETDAGKLADFFHQLNNTAVNSTAMVRICISCRHYPVVVPVPTSVVVEIVAEEHNHDDIATYIMDHLPDDLFATYESQLEAWKALRKTLIEQAKGVFQWAHTVIPLIRRMIRKGKSPEDIHDWLRDVPADLKNAYTYILEDVIDPDDRVQSFQFLQWVVLAERPLTVAEMRYALAASDVAATETSIPRQNVNRPIPTDENMRRLTKALSGGLVEVAHGKYGGEFVQFVHQTVHEFIRTTGLALFSKLTGSAATPVENGMIICQCQAMLYRSCLFYLTRVEIAREVDEKIDEWKKRLIESAPFLSYATLNLLVHAEKAAESRSFGLEKETRVLQKVNEKWVSIYRDLDLFGAACPPAGTTVLHTATRANMTDIVAILACDNEKLNAVNDYGDTAFHSAAQWGHVDLGKFLLEKGAALETTSHNGETALIKAAGRGNVDFVIWLLSEGATSTNVGMGPSGTALYAASLQGKRSVVRTLLDAQADVNAQGGNFGNALQAASLSGNTEIVQILLDAQADVNAQGGQYGNALQAASYSGNTEIVQILLDAQADVNTQGGHFENALQASSYSGNTEIVQILLDAQADVNAQGGQYGNALQAASGSGSTEMVQILLDAQADVNAQGGFYGNALQAASYFGNTEIVQILLDAQADVNAQGGYYGNALQAASFSGNTEIVQILLNAQADVNAQGGKHGTALLAAVDAASSIQISILLQAGANPDFLDQLHRSPSHIAAAKGLLPILQEFPCFSSTIDAQDILLRTPLQLAIIHGHVHCALALLDFKASPLIRDGYGRNALDWATDCPPLIARLHQLFPEITQIDQEEQSTMVRHSIHQLSNTLLHSTLDPTRPLWALVQQLGHYLLFSDDVETASPIFQSSLGLVGHIYDLEYRDLLCDICEDLIRGTRVVCQVCVDSNFCLSCNRKYPAHRRFNSAAAHDTLEVPWEEPSSFQETMDRFRPLLNDLVHRFGGPFEPDANTVTEAVPPPIARPDLPTTHHSRSLLIYWSIGILGAFLCTFFLYKLE